MGWLAGSAQRNQQVAMMAAARRQVLRAVAGRGRHRDWATRGLHSVAVDGNLEPETVLLADICFGEGPRWRDGALFFSDFYANARLSADRKDVVGGGEIRGVDLSGNAFTVATVPGQPSGLGFGPTGCMVRWNHLADASHRV